MGLLSRMLSGRPGGAAITRTIVDAVRVLPGVVEQSLIYHHQPQASGAISGAISGVVSGVVNVTDTPPSSKSCARSAACSNPCSEKVPTG